MQPSLPAISSEAALRHELYARVLEQEPPPILTANPEQKFVLASALQKTVRRGQADNAIRFAVQLHSIDAQYAWRRLAVIALEDVGFGDPLSAAIALEANRSFLFRRKLGELRSLAAVVTGLADGTKSRFITDLLISRGQEYQPTSSNQFRAHVESHAAPWLVRYLALRGFSHAGLGTQVLPAWDMLRDISVTERPPDVMGDQIIAGFPAATWDMFTQEGQRAFRYLRACPPFRAYTPKQIANAVFNVEGGYLHRSIGSLEIGALDLEAKLLDWRAVGITESRDGTKLTMLIRHHREQLNYARKRILLGTKWAQ